ncbi:hypothetical protein [Methylocucumis oryzae]|uniref:hypothetical protein n=1 Tax=Methylocucumis oryzae TaxID=1632867 RepID=UPI000697C5B0|nr:hypothetical protein [Methylocucumis oryzae]
MITTDDVAEMVDYWLATPANSRLGSDFGNNANMLIPDPYNAEKANSFIKKLIKDVPVLGVLPRNAINVYMIEIDIDKTQLILEISGQTFQLNAN